MIEQYANEPVKDEYKSSFRYRLSFSKCGWVIAYRFVPNSILLLLCFKKKTKQNYSFKNNICHHKIAKELFVLCNFI